MRVLSVLFLAFDACETEPEYSCSPYDPGGSLNCESMEMCCPDDGGHCYLETHDGQQYDCASDCRAAVADAMCDVCAGTFMGPYYGCE